MKLTKSKKLSDWWLLAVWFLVGGVLSAGIVMLDPSRDISKGSSLKSSAPVVCAPNPGHTRTLHERIAGAGGFDITEVEKITRTLPERSKQMKTETKKYVMDDLLDAIEMVESGGDPNAVCPDGCCVGAYQLTEQYVDDANRIQGLAGRPKIFTYKDRLDREKSRLMTCIVTAYYAQQDWKKKYWDQMGYLETAARTHKSPTNRNTPETEPYWEKIKKALESK